MNELDQIIKLWIIQLERIASILFFLLPLIILLVIGKHLQTIFYIYGRDIVFFIFYFIDIQSENFQTIMKK